MSFKILVKGADDSKRTLKMKGSDTLQDFKDQVQEIFGSSVELFVHKGKTLSDLSKTLNEYGVKNNSIIQVLPKTRGGKLNKIIY